MMKKIHLKTIAAFSILSLLIIVGCKPTPPPPPPPAITCAFNPASGITCVGARVTFQATSAAGTTLKIVGIAAVATGPNADCATATVIGDSDTRANVIDTGVTVNCDCGPGQTVFVVISVMDNAGNVCDATCTINT